MVNRHSGTKSNMFCEIPQQSENYFDNCDIQFCTALIPLCKIRPQLMKYQQLMDSLKCYTEKRDRRQIYTCVFIKNEFVPNL